MRKLAAALAAVVTLSADAGLIYRYSTKSNAPLARDQHGRVWVDGDRRRTELDPDPENPRTFDLAITKNGKTTLINLQNKTYFYSIPAVAGRGPGLFHLPLFNDGGVRFAGKPTVTYQNAGAGPPIGGRETTKHVIQIRYRLRGDISGEPLQADVDATITIHTAAGLPDDGRSGKITYFPEIDAELERLFASIVGMTVFRETSISRTLEGGPRITEVDTFAIHELTEANIPDRVFAIPPGLTFQEPVYGVPGD